MALFDESVFEDGLFDDALIQTYSEGLLSSDVKLINKDELKKYIESTSIFGLFKSFNISDIVCGNAIDSDYGYSSFKNVYYDYPNFDILAVVPKNHAIRVNNILGFIICELGECKTKPNVWSVNLICMNPHTYSVRAPLLLGAMLYCIKHKTQYEQEAVLELAGGYSNLAGFISYTKMGFNLDPRLFECFDGLYNLPMSANIRNVSTDEIKLRATGARSRVVSQKDDYTGLYNNSFHMSRKELAMEAEAYQMEYWIYMYETYPDKFTWYGELRNLIENAKSKILHQSPLDPIKHPNRLSTYLLNYVHDHPDIIPKIETWTIENSKSHIKKQLELLTKPLRKCKYGRNSKKCLKRPCKNGLQPPCRTRRNS